MSGIDPIKFNAQKRIEPKKEEVKKEQAKEDQVKPEVNHKAAEDILGFMNAQAKANIFQIKADPSQESRIAGFMAEFEDAVASGLVAIEDEFGPALGEADAMALAAESAFRSEFE